MLRNVWAGRGPKTILVLEAVKSRLGNCKIVFGGKRTVKPSWKPKMELAMGPRGLGGHRSMREGAARATPPPGRLARASVD